MPALTANLTDALSNGPAVGVRMQIYWVETHGDVLLRAASTNARGTTDAPLVTGSKLSAGVYKLVLHAGDYFHHTHPDCARCLDVMPIVFVIDDASAGRVVHVSLSPNAYTVQFA